MSDTSKRSRQHRRVRSCFSGSGVGTASEADAVGSLTLRKVFVGGIAWQTSSHSLHAHFAQYGEIVEAVVITDRVTGRSRGYGFVTFASPEAAQRATADANPIVDGRRANCILAALGQSVTASGNAHHTSPGASQSSQERPSVPPDDLGSPAKKASLSSESKQAYESGYAAALSHMQSLVRRQLQSLPKGSDADQVLTALLRQLQQQQQSPRSPITRSQHQHQHQHSQKHKQQPRQQTSPRQHHQQQQQQRRQEASHKRSHRRYASTQFGSSMPSVVPGDSVYGDMSMAPLHTAMSGLSLSHLSIDSTPSPTPNPPAPALHHPPSHSHQQQSQQPPRQSHDTLLWQQPTLQDAGFHRRTMTMPVFAGLHQIDLSPTLSNN